MSLYTIWLTFLQCVQNYCSVSNMSLYTIWLTLMHLFSYTNIWYMYYILLACKGCMFYEPQVIFIRRLKCNTTLYMIWLTLLYFSLCIPPYTGYQVSLQSAIFLLCHCCWCSCYNILVMSLSLLLLLVLQLVLLNIRRVPSVHFVPGALSFCLHLLYLYLYKYVKPRLGESTLT